MSLAEALLINARISNFLQLPTVQSSLNTSLHDALHGIPAKLQQPPGLLHAAAGFDHFEREGFEHEGKARVLLRPMALPQS
jgi:hypothetical protein